MENLLKISLSVALVGIFLLVFLANSLPLPVTNLKDIDDKMLNQKVRVEGKIFRIEDKEGFQILSISDETGKIDVLSESNISEMQEIEVQGRIKEYRGYLQIQADKIIKK